MVMVTENLGREMTFHCGLAAVARRDQSFRMVIITKVESKYDSKRLCRRFKRSVRTFLPERIG